MDSIFNLDDQERHTFLLQMLQSLGSTYICLWLYFPQPSNCLLALDGFYHEEENINQASSSLGSSTQRLFVAYRQLYILVDDNGRVPGLAFKTHSTYMELNVSDLRRLASNTVQLQFYEEARIKRAIFMGCKVGEIELGFFKDPQVDLETKMRSLFPDDFSLVATSREQLPQHTHDPPNRPSSSSSSLRSLSIDSSEYSPLLYSNIINPTGTLIPDPAKESLASDQQALANAYTRSTTTHEKAIQALSLIRSPTMKKSVFFHFSNSPSSSSSSSSSHQYHQQQPQKNAPQPGNYEVLSRRCSAFKRYESALATQSATRIRRPTMLKRAVTFFRSLNVVRTSQEQIQVRRPTSTQLHHMIAERRRREKLNDSFQALRSFIPPGTKKDKASVLSATADLMSSLKAQVADLSKRNQILAAQVLPQKDTSEELVGSSNERISVEITITRSNIAGESTSTEGRVLLDLQVLIRGECSLIDVVLKVLEFLKQDRNVVLMSLQSNTRVMESSVINHAIFRLRIEGSEWDESAFQEAVRRIIEEHVTVTSI